MTVIGLTFKGGDANGNGGSIQVSDGGILNTISTIFTGNRADTMYGKGGAVHLVCLGSSNAYFNAVDTDFVNNLAGAGGGVYVDGSWYEGYPVFNANR